MAATTSTVRRQTRQLAYAIVLTALAVALSPISIPVGIAKVFPAQHMVNVLAGALIGPWWGLAVALVTSIIRNALGLGTPLAFPGSIFGVLLAGLIYRATRNIPLTVAGEVFGTGVLGALTGALLVAPYVMNRPMGITALIVPFALSSLVGAVLGALGLLVLRRTGYLERSDSDR
ncbi:MAG: energy coupling factor transporter S component ThiW [Roseiflexus sp.]